MQSMDPTQTVYCVSYKEFQLQLFLILDCIRKEHLSLGLSTTNVYNKSVVSQSLHSAMYMRA